MSAESLRPTELTPRRINNLTPRRVSECVWFYDDEVGGELFTLTGGTLKGTQLAVKMGVFLERRGFLSRGRDGWSIKLGEGSSLSASCSFGQGKEGDIRNIYVFDANKVVPLKKPTAGKTTSVLSEGDRQGEIAIIPVYKKGAREGEGAGEGGVLVVPARKLFVDQNVNLIGGSLR